MRPFSLALSGTACAAILALSANAAAHIELVEPPPRYALPGNKSCPCGDGDSNRVCQTTAEESTDPNRSTNVTTFEAGSTITVITEEYIDHAGRIRVAFDPNGADLADFNANVLMDVPDPDEAGLSAADPRVWELAVTLPDEPCENCTLQVIQAMHGDTENPVEDPAPLSTYYTCADIRIVPRGTLEAGEGGASNGAGGSASVGEAGAAGSAGGTPEDEEANSPAGGASAGSVAGDAGVTGSADDAENGGCSFTGLTPSRSSLGGGAVLLLGALWAGRQWRRRRQA